MKKIIYLCLVMLLMVGCHKGETTQQVSDNDKLQMIDAQLVKDPDNAELRNERAKVLLGLGRTAEALADAKKAAELNSKNIDYLLTLSDVYFASGNAGESYKTLNKALELDSSNKEALLKMGELSYFSKNFDRAMDCLSQVTAIEKDNRTALTLKSFIYKETGDTASAMRYFQHLCDIYPDYALPYEELGMIYAKHNDPLAIQYLQTAIRLDSTNLNCMYLLGMYFQEHDNPEAAHEVYGRMLVIDPQNKDAWLNRGYLAIVYDNDYDAAIEFITKAIDADNLYAAAHYLRGYAYELKGDRTNASICYRTALQIDADLTKAQEGLQRVQ